MTRIRLTAGVSPLMWSTQQMLLSSSFLTWICARAITPSFASRTTDSYLPSRLLPNPRFFLFLYLPLTVGAARDPVQLRPGASPRPSLELATCRVTLPRPGSPAGTSVPQSTPKSSSSFMKAFSSTPSLSW